MDRERKRNVRCQQVHFRILINRSDKEVERKEDIRIIRFIRDGKAVAV